MQKSKQCRIITPNLNYANLHHLQRLQISTFLGAIEIEKKMKENQDIAWRKHNPVPTYTQQWKVFIFQKGRLLTPKYLLVFGRQVLEILVFKNSAISLSSSRSLWKEEIGYYSVDEICIPAISNHCLVCVKVWL